MSGPCSRASDGRERLDNIDAVIFADRMLAYNMSVLWVPAVMIDDHQR